MISLHPNTSDIGNPRAYANGWQVLAEDTIDNVAELITSHAVSPIIWKDGVRRGANFVEADWLVLDIDEGPSISEAINICQSYQSIIGTTKSHGIKGKHDRYRIFMPFCGLIDCRDMYRASVKEFIREFDADKACADLARMFWPCKEIVYVNKNGFAADIEDAPEMIEAESSLRESGKKAALKLRAKHENGSYPNWVRHALSFGAHGQVNTTCFKIGLCLATIGYDTDKIVALILDSNLPNRNTDVAFTKLRSEVEGAVKSGVKTALANLDNLAVLD